LWDEYTFLLYYSSRTDLGLLIYGREGGGGGVGDISPERYHAKRALRCKVEVLEGRSSIRQKIGGWEAVVLIVLVEEGECERSVGSKEAKTK